MKKAAYKTTHIRIRVDQMDKLRKIARKEKRLISGQLEIVLEEYFKSVKLA